MSRMVQDQEELPENEFGRATFYRISGVPTTLMHGMTGEVFVRADGADWPHSAYQVERDKVTLVKSVVPRPTWYDPYEWSKR